MKKILLVIVVIALAGVLFYRSTIREREIVILSTNDMHATINNIPNLVSAVNMCRDSVETIVVDAGDRWTGNAFVDLAEGRLPIIKLMNIVGYDVATLGNHEFDAGAATVQGSVDNADFDILCANMVSNREDLSTLAPSMRIKTESGIDICFVGVVTNYDNGHPDGSHDVFEGLEFSDPMDAAEHNAKSCRGADVKVLLSHMGDDKDLDFAARYDGYDLIIGGHTHVVLDTIVNNTVIGQTGRRLAAVGATHIRMKGNKVISVDYRNVALKDYPKDSQMLAEVQELEKNPVLNAQIGSVANDVTHIGFANLEAAAIAAATSSDIGLYHYGGVRLNHYPAGAVSLLTLYNLEPFSSKIQTIDMTPAQLRAMIIAKFNDTKNAKESHRVDLFCSTPYDIVVNEKDEAVNVRFPKLTEGKRYSVAMPDYVGSKYEELHGENHTEHNILVLDILQELFENHSPVRVDNKAYQRIVKM